MELFPELIIVYFPNLTKTVLYDIISMLYLLLELFIKGLLSLKMICDETSIIN